MAYPPGGGNRDEPPVGGDLDKLDHPGTQLVGRDLDKLDHPGTQLVGGDLDKLDHPATQLVAVWQTGPTARCGRDE